MGNKDTPDVWNSTSGNLELEIKRGNEGKTEVGAVDDGGESDSSSSTNVMRSSLPPILISSPAKKCRKTRKSVSFEKWNPTEESEKFRLPKSEVEKASRGMFEENRDIEVEQDRRNNSDSNENCVLECDQFK